jgi:5-(carboxyamino)imidazole ribonucleotide synthase
LLGARRKRWLSVMTPVLDKPALHPLKQGATIGILGGGQLGRMLALAGAELGFDVHIYEPEADCPAGRVSAKCITAPWDDHKALEAFARNVDVVTFEFENVPAASLAQVAAIKPIRPGAKSLELTQDRLIEKQFINSLGLTTASFSTVAGLEGLRDAVVRLGPEGILKTRRFGYDGKGQIRIEADTDLLAVSQQIEGSDWILEGFVDFQTEVSVVLARSIDGQIAAFDVTQNVHVGGILHTSTVPASIHRALEQTAIAQATAIATALDHVGVLAVEFFVTKAGALIVNEIAPRVHNSGHWTQDGCNACQFQQHMRAVAGWPLGDPTRHTPHIEMTNLIGDDVADWRALAAQTGTFLHLYGKRDARVGRKMGHVNRINLPSARDEPQKPDTP